MSANQSRASPEMILEEEEEEVEEEELEEEALTREAKPSGGTTLRSTVFDAVESRLITRGFAYTIAQRYGLLTASGRLDLSKTDQPERWFREPLTPAEALFSRGSAPERYAENDLYDQARHLYGASTRADGKEEESPLPDGDLCAALHTFASDFYATLENAGLTEEQVLAKHQHRKTQKARSSSDFHSLDETALLALGMLVEEWVEDWLSQGAADRVSHSSFARDDSAEEETTQQTGDEEVTAAAASRAAVQAGATRARSQRQTDAAHRAATLQGRRRRRRRSHRRRSPNAVHGSGDVVFTEGLHDRVRSPSGTRWVNVAWTDEAELHTVDDRVTTDWAGSSALATRQRRRRGEGIVPEIVLGGRNRQNHHHHHHHPGQPGTSRVERNNQAVDADAEAEEMMDPDAHTTTEEEASASASAEAAEAAAVAQPIRKSSEKHAKKRGRSTETAAAPSVPPRRRRIQDEFGTDF